MTDDERDAQAGEYVIGTMPPEERVAFEREMAADPALRALVHAWEERLAGLADMVPNAAPDPQTWSAIERALDRMMTRTVGDTAQALDRAFPLSSPDPLLLLQRSRRRWRAAAVSFAALAAALILFVATGLRTERRDSYLAVVNRGGELPALVVEVDAAAGVVRVRSLAAETPPEHSLELWYIAASGAPPRSLGLVDQPRGDTSIPAVARTGDLAGGTLAVSVEPKGGSPTGGPTGQVIYSGKLVRN